MTGPTHVITGLAAAVAIGRLSSVQPDAVNLLTLLLGVLAPDIDGGGVITRPGKVLYRLVGRTLAGLIDAVCGIVVGAVELLFSHRGFLHSPVFALALLLVGIGTGTTWLVWFSVGYVTHLIGDAFTAGGIPMFAPYRTRMVSMSSMRTGSPTEFVLAGVMLLFTGLCGWVLLPDGVKQSHVELYTMISRAAGER